MAVDQFELFHGLVLAKLVRNDHPIALRLIETREMEPRSVYRINDVILCLQRPQTVRVRLKEHEYLHVSGSRSKQELPIPSNRIDRWQVPGS